MKFAARILRESIDVLLDPRTGRRDATDAARVAALVCARIGAQLDEASLSDLMRAAEQWLPVRSVLASLLRAVRARCAPERARRLARGIARLAAHSSDRRLFDALSTLVRAMQDEPELRAHIAPAWFVRALDHELQKKNAGPLVEHLLCGWFRSAHDATPNPELRDCIERNPRLFTTEMSLAPFLCWRVHEVAPTVAGWKALAANPFGLDATPSPSSFGPELDTAVDTLESALAEEREGARRVTLARWLIDLRGEA